MGNSLTQNRAFSKVSGFFMPAALITIIIILIIPLPAFILDLLITANIAMSILVLLVVLNSKEAIELSVFSVFIVICYFV